MYNINPVFPLEKGRIYKGPATLAERLSREKTMIFDGYQGVYFGNIREQLDKSFKRSGLSVIWQDVATAMLPATEIERLLVPFLGGDDPLFGTRCTLNLIDLFDPEKLKAINPDLRADINIIYGVGASLAGWEGCLMYADLPKNVMQYRSRKGSITNLGASSPGHAKQMYKRFYFADWVMLNRHKDKLSGRVDIIVDAQDETGLSWMEGDDLRMALHNMSRNVFRVKPWFEPGAWGGTWIREHIPGLRTDVPNFAWSFEMIVPENGLTLESKGNRLEMSFDWLMFREAASVLGDCHERFGKEFPIRFDFLDTFDGGSLSVQCHPQEGYIKKHFGENFTQQEAYYILDTRDHALVNLGFQEDIDPEKFIGELEKSARDKTEVDIPRFIQQLPASKHDFFLIPSYDRTQT